jgi:magnesium transporter
MLKIEYADNTTGMVMTVEPESIEKYLQEENGILWVDIQHPTDVDFVWLSNIFKFHPLAIEDASNNRQRPKIENYQNYYFLVLRSPHGIRQHRVETSQLSAFVGKNYLVTLHRNSADVFDDMRKRWKESSFNQKMIPFLCYLFMDATVDQYFPLIDSIGDKIEKIDEDMLTSQDANIPREVIMLRKQLLHIRKQLAPMRDAVNLFIRSEEDGGLFTLENMREYFIDIYDHLLRLTEYVDTYRDILSGSMECYQSSLSNTLNVNMQRLTVITTVLATGSVLSGLYGMNLRGMGIGSESVYGGYIVLVVFLLIALIEILIFRKKGWI